MAMSDFKIMINYDKVDLEIIDPQHVADVTNGEVRCQTLMLTIDEKVLTVSLMWKGSVNGEICLGCELKIKTDRGTNGTFNGERLFNCADKKGVLIVRNKNLTSCEFGSHKVIECLRYDVIDKNSICCIRPLDKMQKYSNFAIGVKVKKLFVHEFQSGTCRWIGSINGKEMVGVEMDSPLKHGCSGSFNGIKLFECTGGHGFLFSAESLSTEGSKDVPLKVKAVGDGNSVKEKSQKKRPNSKNKTKH